MLRAYHCSVPDEWASEVVDLDEAVRVERGGSSEPDLESRGWAGVTWWYVMDFCAERALDQMRRLEERSHPDQSDLEWFHALIRSGLDPGPHPNLESR